MNSKVPAVGHVHQSVSQSVQVSSATVLRYYTGGGIKQRSLVSSAQHFDSVPAGTQYLLELVVGGSGRSLLVGLHSGQTYGICALVARKVIAYCYQHSNTAEWYFTSTYDRSST